MSPCFVDCSSYSRPVFSNEVSFVSTLKWTVCVVGFSCGKKRMDIIRRELSLCCLDRRNINTYPSLEAVFANGNEVGDLAMGLFGDFVEVTVYTDDKLDIAAMIERTKEEIEKNTENICEASFSYNGLYCAVDILRKEKDGYAIYEVKSSTMSIDEPDVKAVYVADIAYNRYIGVLFGILYLLSAAF